MMFLMPKVKQANNVMLDLAEHEIKLAHKSNMKALAVAREKADNLNKLLIKNHISVQIYKATGKQNVPNPTTS